MTRVEGYYRFASVHGNDVVFVSEDDIWSVPISGGIARRLTAGVSECSYPRLSPDGSMIAFVAKEEGHPEIYLMPAEGGLARRLTFLGSDVCVTAGWHTDSKSVIFVSDAKAAFFRHNEIYEVSIDGGMPQAWNIGHAVSVAFDGTTTVIGRNNNDPARWKRYRGGTAGELWVDAQGTGEFKPLIQLKGNLASPMLIDKRVYFLSDHEGIGNIYSCTVDGADLKRHTDHEEYFVRHPSTDGQNIVYTAGGDLYRLDPRTGDGGKIEVRISSAPRQAVRKFVPAGNNLEEISVHPRGHSVGLISRGQPFTMAFWEEAVVQHGFGSKTRYRGFEWLPGGEEFVVINDLSGYERVELHKADQSADPEYITDEDIGRSIEVAVSPVGKKIALANHRHELIVVDIEAKTVKTFDRAPADRITGVSWSADGRWIAYSYSAHPNTRHIRIGDTTTGEIKDVTRPLRHDFDPCWDPDGKYLYFLANREFNPIYDAQQFDLSFPYGTKLYLVTLRTDVKSPFVPEPKALFEDDKAKSKDEEEEEEEESESETENGAAAEGASEAKDATAAAESETEQESEGEDEDAPEPVEIEFEGIADRMLSFPFEEGRYRYLAALKGRVVFCSEPLVPITRHNQDEEDTQATLFAYDFNEHRLGTLVQSLYFYSIGLDQRTIVYYTRENMRAIDGLMSLPEGAPDKPADEVGRKTGWFDINRAQVMIEPYAEWRQMFDESWRLQREHFWDERMSGIDWDVVYERYSRLLPRINSRWELSDLIWEMQGELGTSHAYEMGGDYREPNSYHRGFLGAEFEWDETERAYKITRIVRGDSWDPEADSPLAQPGLGVKEGDYILAVGGRRATKECSLDELLINYAGADVMLTIKFGDGTRKAVPVRALRSERDLRYRNWVETNRRYVHEKTDGRIGYLHIPDMGAWGFAEFHRNFLSEIHREGLLVDVRFNRGGHVSPLLLEKLARKRVGYDVSRWGVPSPYPPESVAGPMVALTNQFAGSDGDIFSHCFKLYGLGPLVGKRTWGGVIGIWPRHHLVDGTVTTQPEFSFWFTDVGWKVENYGTDPDYEVDIAPQDYKHGNDPQLDKGLELILDSLKQKPFKLPTFDQRPDLRLPKFEKGRK
jgi:tricorn protease